MKVVNDGKQMEKFFLKVCYTNSVVLGFREEALFKSRQEFCYHQLKRRW